MSNLETLTSAARNASAWHLVLDKIPFRAQDGLPVLSASENQTKLQSIKAKRLQEIVKLTERPETKDLWREAIASRKSLLDTLQAQHGQSFATLTLVNSSRLLLHLGRASVLENVGLYCDHTTGLPLIPGTAVKGALSTWACWETNQSDEGTFPEAKHWTIARSGHHQRSFGDNSQSPGMEAAGGIMVLGGFPLTPPQLELDILTPHPDEGRGRLTPNVFLSLGQGTMWVFAFLALRPETQDDLPEMLRLARECLSLGGLGAKTASGYGQFRDLTDQECAKLEAERASAKAALLEKKKEEEERKRLGSLPPEERAYFEFVAKQTDWIAAARDIAKHSENEKLWILRYFRSEPGTALLKTWTNKKGLNRIENLKNAGL